MFKLNGKPSPSYFAPVTVAFPVDVDKYHEETFVAEFKRMTRDEIAAVEKGSGGDTAAFVRSVMVGWRDVTDADTGEQVPFTPAALDQLLQAPPVALAVMRDFYASLAGRLRGN